MTEGPDALVVAMSFVGVFLLFGLMLLRRRRERMGPWAAMVIDLYETSVAAAGIVCIEIMDNWRLREQLKLNLLLLVRGLIDIIAVWAGVSEHDAEVVPPPYISPAGVLRSPVSSVEVGRPACSTPSVEGEAQDVEDYDGDELECEDV